MSPEPTRRPSASREAERRRSKSPQRRSGHADRRSSSRSPRRGQEIGRYDDGEPRHKRRRSESISVDGSPAKRRGNKTRERGGSRERCTRGSSIGRRSRSRSKERSRREHRRLSRSRSRSRERQRKERRYSRSRSPPRRRRDNSRDRHSREYSRDRSSKHKSRRDNSRERRHRHNSREKSHRTSSRDRSHRTSSRDRSHKPRPHRSPSPSSKPTTKSTKSSAPLPPQSAAFATETNTTPPPPEKQKPNLQPTGLLARQANTVAGTSIALKYHEPPEARLPPPSASWSLVCFKGAEHVSTTALSSRSCWLVGREEKVVDLWVGHGSASGQHAVLQFRFRGAAPAAGGGSAKGMVKPYVIDLESRNGTRLNGEKLDPGRYVEVRSGDVLKFGESEREWVIMLAPKD